MIHKVLILGAFFVFSDTKALEFEYELSSYPTKENINNFIKSDPVSIKVCCRYPSQSEIETLNKLNLRMLKITAGFFPSEDEMNILNKYIGEYSISLSEVFPSKKDFLRMNNSNISELIINSIDFLTMGEVKAFNNFDINLRVNINHQEYPLPRHMKVLKLLKSKFTVAFRNHALPGIGHANFFNALKTKKIFTAINKFPYGEDYIGVNALSNSVIEISPDEYLYPQDVEQINKMNKTKDIYLGNQAPFSSFTIDLIKSISANKVYVKGFGEFDEQNVDIFRTAKSNIILVK